ncbi:MAG: winged helix-turn-helix transcriptional regulator [Chthonomonadetes bacterium]|nr:winged helix-turn-helix transcriptional regulator [Chthonomonadetes bacterium]
MKLSDIEATFRALADANRLRILALVQEAPLCVCQLMAILDISQSTVSKHLAILKEAGLVEEDQQGKRSFYRLSTRFPSELAESVVRQVLEELRDSPELAEDRKLSAFMREYRIETMSAAQNLRQKRRTLRVL